MFRQIKEPFSKIKKLAKKQPEILRYEELEQRLLFSADVVPGLDNIAVEEQVLVEDVSKDVQTEREAAQQTAAQTAAQARSELVLVNENVADYEQLIADLQGSDNNRIIEVVVLESDRDGIEQVSEILAERSDLAAVHFISHGSDGQINLGNSWLNSTSLEQNSDAISAWGNALTEDGDILFYGCNIAADSDGQTLLGKIAEVTGAEVAASDDATGHELLGGDWELEYAPEVIETKPAFSIYENQKWSGLLAVPVANNDSYSVGEDNTLDTNALSGWQYRTRLTFNNSAQTEDLIDFPVLIKLNSSRIDYAQTEDNGEDLRFYDSDGTTPLAHEIELWDKGGTSYVWVKVPRIDAGSGSDFIYMDYGNGSVLDGQNAAAVWSNGYRAVYHLDEDPGAGGTVADSTGLFDASNAGSTDTGGSVSNGQDFDGVSQYVNLGQDRDFINNATAATVSAWINPDTTAATGDILGVTINGAVDTGASRAAIIRNGDNVHVIARTMDDSSDTVNVTTTTSPLTAGSWHYVSATIDFAGDVDNIKIYVDGNLEGTFSHNFTNNAIPNTNSTNAAIGTDEDGGAPYFEGQIDEARIATTDRSADWIAAQYLSMTDNFVNFGSKQVLDGVLANDVDQDGDPLIVSEVEGVAGNVGSAVAGSNGGTFTIAADGSFSFDPGSDFDDLAVSESRDTSIDYTLSDGTTTDSTTVTVTVNGADDAININATGNTVTFTEDAGATAALFSAAIDTLETGDTISQVILTMANVESGDTLSFGATSVDLNTTALAPALLTV